MGYRSEVAITMKKDDYNILMEQANDSVKELIEYGEVKDKGNVIILYWNEVKWCGYDDVDFIMDFLDNLRENDKPFSFIRLGEDPIDIEERFFFGDNEEDYFDCNKIHICKYIEIEE